MKLDKNLAVLVSHAVTHMHSLYSVKICKFISLKLCWGGRALPPGKELLVPIGRKARWAPEPVWTRWRREKLSVPAGNWTSVVQPVAKLCTDWAIPVPIHEDRAAGMYIKQCY
jgi:hypothetical protein